LLDKNRKTETLFVRQLMEG